MSVSSYTTIADKQESTRRVTSQKGRHCAELPQDALAKPRAGTRAHPLRRFVRLGHIAASHGLLCPTLHGTMHTH